MAVLTPAELLREARAIERSLPPDTPRLGIVASFTSNLLHPYLVYEAQQTGWPLLPWHGPFGQFEQVLMQDSELWAQKPEALWIALRLQDAEPRLMERSHSLGSAGVKSALSGVCGRLAGLARAARSRTSAPIFVSNLELEQVRSSRPFEACDPDGLFYLIDEANRELARLLGQIPDTFLFDWAGMVGACGAAGFTDPKLWHMAKSAVASQHLPRVARALLRSVTAALRPPLKCIVLDLDNTLWGGVLGDDGPAGVKLGGEYPGNVFVEFQSALLGLTDRGFLLAAASKNDASTVDEMLRSHPDMLLRHEHFACIRANWSPKPQNLRDIAAELNIGLDSLLFIDDNPVERAQMRAELPMVHVLELPESPLGYLDALRGCALLDRPRLLSDDANRVAMYRDNALRVELQQQVTSLEEYLQQLEMVAEVAHDSRSDLERIHQLINKTNQFNLTTRRHKLDEVRSFMDDPSYRVASLRLSDRFGDMGLVCVGILSGVGSEVAQVDTLLMSCRVMGRFVEDAFLAYLARLAREEGAVRLRGVFRATAKNAPVARFYEERGFRMVAPGEPEAIWYEKDLAPGAFPWPGAIGQKQLTKEAVYDSYSAAGL
ncbi:HAD-IIIC family phosphatase [Geomonas nitrogeniifigens]|uniref:HAD-IIIC family phosphatase n=1 Tax=Geomonas diazotrophica TaxID=2843197 RepID=A0ABX8JC24_9BACT|nr:HAD-IIIC family phosphatase [Geomonas nitrogeniifigens]QWV95959.1 HAD-IIIC family phosphatase [Geomonas nitrogeniifigens]